MGMEFQVAQILIQAKAVHFSFDPPFTYTSGMKGPIYLDNRKIMSYPKLRSALIQGYLQEIKKQVKEPISCISATATAAIPMGAWLADHLNLPLVYVRMQSKKHGLGNQIEGELIDKKNVLVIEDHLSSAKSIRENVEAIRAAGGVVTTAMSTTTYQHPLAKSNIEEMNLKMISLASGYDIIQVAYENGILTFEQKESIAQWFRDPLSWDASKTM